MWEDTEEVIINGQSIETGNIGNTKRREVKQKNNYNTICVGHHHKQTQTRPYYKQLKVKTKHRFYAKS